MTNIEIISIFPELIAGACQYGVLGQAIKKNLIQINCINPRQFTNDVHKTVDDRPFGGGDGMVMLFEPLEKALNSIARRSNCPVIYLSPQGAVFNDEKARALAKLEQMILVCGRYGGIDQRFINKYVDQELSIGDYVLSGGEFAALTVIDATSRMIPGVLGHAESNKSDSFSDGLLEAPTYTRPQQIDGMMVPAMLMSGHHQKINNWKNLISVLVTFQKRFDLLKGLSLSSENKSDLIDLVNSLGDKDFVVLGLKGFSKDKFLLWLKG